MDPIYRVTRREPGAPPVEPVDRLRLLSPAEREEARRKREEKRREAAARSAKRPAKKSPQDPGSRTDYFG